MNTYAPLAHAARAPHVYAFAVPGAGEPISDGKTTSTLAAERSQR